MKMQSAASEFDNSVSEDRRDFSLVLGGPLFQLLCAAHLSDNALHVVKRRIIAFILLAWLPLLVLSFVRGHALVGNVTVPFLRDIDVHIRFLVALPVLIIAELVVHRRMRPIVEQFSKRRMIPGNAVARFNAAFASAMRLRNSILAEVLIIVAVYLVGVLIVWRHYTALDAASWYATSSREGAVLSAAGIWYCFVSLPLFQFLLIRWYFRILIWARFLWQVSRIRLILIPSHPDRVGGLGFLANTGHAFAPLAAAHGALLAGLIANRIFFLGATLSQFKLEIAAVVIFMLCLTLGPLLAFTPQLALSKRSGGLEYGELAEDYVRAFHAKWLRGKPVAEPLIGSTDIQSLADLANSFEVVRSMRLVPFTREGFLLLVAATLAPVLPLALTMMPLDDILKALLGVLF